MAVYDVFPRSDLGTPRKAFVKAVGLLAEI